MLCGPLAAILTTPILHPAAPPDVDSEGFVESNDGCPDELETRNGFQGLATPALPSSPGFATAVSAFAPHGTTICGVVPARRHPYGAMTLAGFERRLSTAA